jgi:hypothetical protein
MKLLLPLALLAAAPQSVVVARWQGGEIALEGFLRRLALERLKLELRRGAPLADDARARVALASAVLEGAVNQALFVAEARRRGLRVGDAQTRQAIRRFARAAKVAEPALRRRLRAAGASWRELERSVRSELIARRLILDERAKIRASAADMERARAEARWRGEGHLSDAALRARLLSRRLAERVEALARDLRARAGVQIFLKADQALGAAERQAIEKKALSFYRRLHAGAPADIAVDVVPMGCHTEIVLKSGPRTLARLGYSDGKVFELGKR